MRRAQEVRGARSPGIRRGRGRGRGQGAGSAPEGGGRTAQAAPGHLGSAGREAAGWRFAGAPPAAPGRAGRRGTRRAAGVPRPPRAGLSLRVQRRRLAASNRRPQRGSRPLRGGRALPRHAPRSRPAGPHAPRGAPAGITVKPREAPRPCGRPRFRRDPASEGPSLPAGPRFRLDPRFRLKPASGRTPARWLPTREDAAPRPRELPGGTRAPAPSRKAGEARGRPWREAGPPVPSVNQRPQISTHGNPQFGAGRRRLRDLTREPRGGSRLRRASAGSLRSTFTRSSAASARGPAPCAPRGNPATPAAPEGTCAPTQPIGLGPSPPN